MVADSSLDPVVRMAWQQVLRQERTKLLRTITVQFLFFAGLLLGWHLLAAANLWETTLFPAPAEVLATLQRGVADFSLIAAIVPYRVGFRRFVLDRSDYIDRVRGAEWNEGLI